jgi:hypothetical protein
MNSIGVGAAPAHPLIKDIKMIIAKPLCKIFCDFIHTPFKPALLFIH